MALGARPANIFKLVVGQGLRLTAVGIGIGLIAAFALTRLMTTMLVGVISVELDLIEPLLTLRQFGYWKAFHWLDECSEFSRKRVRSLVCEKHLNRVSGDCFLSLDQATDPGTFAMMAVAFFLIATPGFMVPRTESGKARPYCGSSRGVTFS